MDKDFDKAEIADAEFDKLCSTQEQDDEIGKAYAALDKLYELLSCGDKRVELSSAKEILSLLGIPDDAADNGRVDKLEVEIKIV